MFNYTNYFRGECADNRQQFALLFRFGIEFYNKSTPADIVLKIGN